MGDESNPKTLYVGNLDASVSEDLLCALFSQMGPVKGCKIIREAGNDPYAFVEYTNHQSASTALAAMNKRLFLDKEMKVNWATSPGNQPKQDTSNHHHIFVGDLSPEIETHTLREAFAPFGEISNCRIVRDPQTLKSKGYAFVSFVKKQEAESAIQAMNGQWLGNRSIRTNWSTRKPPPPRNDRPRNPSNSKQATFDEVYNQSSPTNCTVYFGGFTNGGISEELVQKTFGSFGPIQDIRVFKDKGYAFIRFATKEAATHAIESVHNTDINGQTVKCFWGKESGDPSHVQPAPTATNASTASVSAAQYQYPYGQMGYWYSQYPSAAPTAAAAAQAAQAAQMQNTYVPAQMQPNYAAAYGQFSYPQAYMQRMGLQVPWQAMPGQPAAATASVPGQQVMTGQPSIPQQSAVMYMQQFPTP